MPFAESVPTEREIRVFLVLQESDAPPTMIKILPNCSWEEFDKAATKALKLPVGDEIQYQYFLGMLPVLL